MVGLPIAAAVGAIGGDANAGLEVLKHATPESIAAGKSLLASGAVTVGIQQPCEHILFSQVTVFGPTESVCVTIADGHTNVIKIAKTVRCCLMLAIAQRTATKRFAKKVIA